MPTIRRSFTSADNSCYRKDVDDYPISSDYADEMEDGFVKLDGDTSTARWSGDQTKYIPPTRYQSAATAAKNTLESLTFTNAQSTAETATKSLTSAASAFLRSAMKSIPTMLPPQWQHPSAALRFAATSTPRERTSTQWLRGVGKEQEALADAYLAGELEIVIRDPDDAAARKYSTEMICDDVHNLPADIGSGLQWSEEGQEDDPLRVSGVFERPVMLQARERRERVREVWRAKEERGGRGWAV